MPIELKHVSYRYPSAGREPVTAVQDLSFHIADGEFVGIMGSTGCGKSTLLQLMAGLLAPAEGQILIDGADINGRKYDRRILRGQVGMVFQYPEYQLFETTVERDVAFGLKHSGLTRAEIAEQVNQALSLVGFDSEYIAPQSPLSLSGGEKRRVAIAGVLAAHPRILLFDEPVAGLDPHGREHFLHMVTQINQKGTTVVMVSHNADALCECAGRLLVLADGRLALDREAGAAFSDADALCALGLETSTAGRIAQMLTQREVRLPQPVANYEQLLSGLVQKFSGGVSR